MHQVISARNILRNILQSLLSQEIHFYHFYQIIIYALWLGKAAHIAAAADCFVALFGDHADHPFPDIAGSAR